MSEAKCDSVSNSAPIRDCMSQAGKPERAAPVYGRYQTLLPRLELKAPANEKPLRVINDRIQQIVSCRPEKDNRKREAGWERWGGEGDLKIWIWGPHSNSDVKWRGRALLTKPRDEKN